MTESHSACKLRCSQNGLTSGAEGCVDRFVRINFDVITNSDKAEHVLNHEVRFVTEIIAEDDFDLF